ncbi:MAG: hypothetical protein R3B57_04560 [Phycisphaerales bacterium]
MSLTSTRTRARRNRLGRFFASRRGIASVLAMMFLIVFGSLVAAMGVASTGNVRTASMHLRVMRAMGAAETGMDIAQARLQEAASRFVVAESDIDATIATALWTGDSGVIGDHQVLPPPSGFDEGSLPAGIMQALVNEHAADLNIVTGGEFIDEPAIAGAPSGTDTSVYSATNWVYTPAVGVEAPPQNGTLPPAFQIRYAPLADGKTIRIIVDGIVFDDMRSGEPIRRTISKDFRIVKRVDSAIISPNRIMIGKNVMVEGNLGARFEDVEYNNGDPLIIKSDFYGLDPALDAKLDEFYEAVKTSDVDGDNRLRVGHPTEGAAIPADDDFNGDTLPDGAFQDATQDGYLDDFDIFIRHFDANGDNRVTLSTALTAGTPADGESPEFTLDEDLAELIDSALPDRNKNGKWGWLDVNNDNKYDPVTETPNDWDDYHSVYADVALGWRDGYIDVLDQYAKVVGRLMFTVDESDWVDEQGDYHEKLQGPIDPESGQAPITFSAPDDEVPLITADSFTDTETDLQAAADGDPFWDQVADQLGVSIPVLDTWTVDMNSGGADDPWFEAVWADNNYDGLPDNASDAYFEKSPFNSPAFADYYYRPVFKRFVFRNCQIPMGLNALFEDCTFVGVTYVRTYEANTYPHWTVFGKLEIDGTSYPTPEFPRTAFGDESSEVANADDAYDGLPDTAIPPEQVIMLANSPLDKGDILDSQIASFSSSDYDSLPEPLIIDGKRVTDTKLYSNNIRFHDCLFVGSIISDTPQNFTQVRNKLQFTGATRFTDVHPELPDDGYYNPDPGDMEEIAKSSMMLPNYSVDIGSFNSPPEQNVYLHGAIIAGVLDARGNTTIEGALLLTYQPVYGEGPLVDVTGAPVGNPAGFNATLGYFGPEDGDFESLDPNTLPEIGGVKIVGWDLPPYDGLPDLPYNHDPIDAQAQGGVIVPFHGYGKVLLRYDPNMTLPSGIRLPLRATSIVGTYHEGGL